MPSYLDFDSTKNFRDYILGKTLNQPNGPQTYTSTNYAVQSLSDLPNTNPGAVDDNRTQYLLNASTGNVFKPLEYDVRENFNTLPRKANLELYPYFTPTNNTLISLFNQDGLELESELVRFSSKYLSSPDGPVNARISQNLDVATNGKIRLLDALNGNTATAINIITGREPLIEKNNKITVAKTLPGKAIDFIQTVTGVEFPFSEIPGDYLSNPANPVNYRPQAKTELGAIIQDVTGALGSLIGIQRRPKLSRKPSDLMIEYMGEGQKSSLYDNLSFSKYAPNYTTSARSQNSSKVFNFIDNFAEGVKNILGVEAPRGVAYIGDDRGNDVKYAMNDFNDRPVRSSYYLGLMFDPVQAELFQRTKNISEGGEISGKLTWISRNSKNKLGTHNKEWSTEQSTYANTLSTNYEFRESSILGVTQELLDTLPKDGASSRSHVANVIDQTSRFFKDGDLMVSRGSAVKYVNNTTGQETGAEFCRVWTKDRSYMNYSDTMKRTGNIRKYGDSVMENPWNLNIAPMSNGKKGPESFDQSSNIKKGPNKQGFGANGFYAKKYMFSIENLAWGSSTLSGFTYNDLPYCERGPNGGRVMWFPPYDLKVSEQNSAKWESNSFLGRPEPIYTYQNTERSGQISFKVIVDHPSILNLLVREHFQGMSDEDADDYINAFFAGCQDVDFYDLIRRYTTLTADDVKLIKYYLEGGVDSQTIKTFRVETDPLPDAKPDPSPIKNEGEKLNTSLIFPNDVPRNTGSIVSGENYGTLYAGSIGKEDNSYTTTSLNELESALTRLLPLAYSDLTSVGIKAREDMKVLYGKPKVEPDSPGVWTTKIQSQKDSLSKEIQSGKDKFETYKKSMDQLKEDIKNGSVQEVVIKVDSSCSAVADDNYNYKLSARRSHSIIRDIFYRLTGNDKLDFKWNLPNGSPTTTTESAPIEKTFKDLGFADKEGKIIIKAINHGEKAKISDKASCTDANFNDKTLRINAPIAFGCRQSEIKMEYTKAIIPQQPQKPTTGDIPPRTRLIPDGKIKTPSKTKKPNIDVMKRIIMKTLSECHYFKILEEKDPVIFSSLKEKLKYFHPGFHSMTPEGLNARLTFIQQCIRPGNTIPIKGIADDLDLNARNTTFGPPPICILRVGDFYHSKIIIRDVNITFDDSTWDLNPEGIGVQPMLANVSLQVNFIGGQGLSKPVERLQNALSSNFYANTEMYDERSINTAETINGEDREKFTKKFLEDIQYNPQETVDSNNTNDGKNLIDGEYLGKPLTGLTLSYDDLINSAYETSQKYIDGYQSFYNELNKKYGPKVMNLLVGSTYRTVNKYDVFTEAGTTPGKTLDLFGQYKQNKPLSNFVTQFSGRVNNAVKDFDLCEVLGFNLVLPKTKIAKTNDLLRPFIKTLVTEKISSITDNKSIKTFEGIRDEMIGTLDKLNYLVKYQKELVVKKEIPYDVELSGFTYDKLYNQYSNSITYLEKNGPKLFEDIDTTIDFNNPSIDIETLRSLLTVWLSTDEYDKKLIDLFSKDTTVYDTNTVTKLKESLNDFIKPPKEVTFKMKPIKNRKSDKPVTFNRIEDPAPVEISDSNISDEAKKLFSLNVPPIGDKLNYYKIPKAK